MKPLLACCLVGLLASGCRTRPGDLPKDIEPYRTALTATDPAVAGRPEAGVLSAGIERFIGFYTVYSAERIREQVRLVYADDIYFRDPFHEVHGIGDLEVYFLRAAEPVAECTFEITDWVEGEGEVYLRWVMRLRTTGDDESFATLTPGMTHIRFNAEGKVSFHMDYWDPSGAVYGRVPILSGLVRAVRKRI